MYPLCSVLKNKKRLFICRNIVWPFNCATSSGKHLDPKRLYIYQVLTPDDLTNQRKTASHVKTACFKLMITISPLSNYSYFPVSTQSKTPDIIGYRIKAISLTSLQMLNPNSSQTSTDNIVHQIHTISLYATSGHYLAPSLLLNPFKQTRPLPYIAASSTNEP